MSRVPIRLRVAGAFAVAMTAALAVTGLFLYVRLGEHLTDALDRELKVRAQDLGALVREPGSTLATSGGPLIERGESYAQVLDEQGRVVDATPPLGNTELLTPRELARARRGTIVANRGPIPGLDEPSRLLATPIETEGRRVVLVVGSTREERAETLASVRNTMLVLIPLAVLLASAAGYALAGVSLAAVESMRRRAEEISAERPGERLPVPRTRDEIARLGETLNEMLERLEAALERERDFVADAGHELRTPLALLRTQLELALRQPSSLSELRETVRASMEEVDRLAQLAEDLLLIARIERGRMPLRLETLEPSELLASVARRFELRAGEAARPLSASASGDGTLRGDRIRLEQALGNLVDNALRHGAGAVRLSAKTLDGVVELHVSDEGGGFAPDFLGQAFERFTRADPARGRGGSGLGLAIVRMIAEAHGGSAHARNADTGADVWVALPRADEQPET